LKAWQPLLTPKTVLPTLFVAGIIFAPLGGLFLYESDTVSIFDFHITRHDANMLTQMLPFRLIRSMKSLLITHNASHKHQDNQRCWATMSLATPLLLQTQQACYVLDKFLFSATANHDLSYDDFYAVIRAPTYELVNSTTWMNGVAPSDGSLVPRCNIVFTIPMQLNTPIFLYYKLTNFYQNHRKYVKSLSYNQLKGQDISSIEAATSCTQMSTDASGKVYYPCGLIANSVFNGNHELS
jgi:hypothetical protein